MQTDEDFTALHFASFHGNFNIIKILVEKMFADFRVTNIYGANVLHIAAQGDMPTPLYYFTKIKNLDMNEPDNRGCTPLHWACFKRSEFALHYLLALGADLEIQDQAGFTALHLAVKGVAELKSTRSVRALLLRGADRQAKTFENETAI